MRLQAKNAIRLDGVGSTSCEEESKQSTAYTTTPPPSVAHETRGQDACPVDDGIINGVITVFLFCKKQTGQDMVTSESSAAASTARHRMVACCLGAAVGEQCANLVEGAGHHDGVMVASAAAHAGTNVP